MPAIPLTMGTKPIVSSVGRHGVSSSPCLHSCDNPLSSQLTVHPMIAGMDGRYTVIIQQLRQQRQRGQTQGEHAPLSMGPTYQAFAPHG